jgi:hypothetical protein
LRSRAVGSEFGEMALWSFEKAPVSAIFANFFAGFRRVFRRAQPSGCKSARIGRLTTGKRGTSTTPNSPAFAPRMDLEPITIRCQSRACRAPGLRALDRERGQTEQRRGGCRASRGACVMLREERTGSVRESCHEREAPGAQFVAQSNF